MQEKAQTLNEEIAKLSIILENMAINFEKEFTQIN